MPQAWPGQVRTMLQTGSANAGRSEQGHAMLRLPAECISLGVVGNHNTLQVWHVSCLPAYLMGTSQGMMVSMTNTWDTTQVALHLNNTTQ
jgi:hypothetical protein